MRPESCSIFLFYFLSTEGQFFFAVVVRRIQFEPWQDLGKVHSPHLTVVGCCSHNALTLLWAGVNSRHVLAAAVTHPLALSLRTWYEEPSFPHHILHLLLFPTAKVEEPEKLLLFVFSDTSNFLLTREQTESFYSPFSPPPWQPLASQLKPRLSLPCRYSIH